MLKKYFKQNLYDLKGNKNDNKFNFLRIDFLRSHKDHRHFLNQYFLLHNLVVDIEMLMSFTQAITEI